MYICICIHVSTFCAPATAHCSRVRKSHSPNNGVLSSKWFHQGSQTCWTHTDARIPCAISVASRWDAQPT